VTKKEKERYIKWSAFVALAVYVWWERKRSSSLGQDNGSRFVIDGDLVIDSVAPFFVSNPILSEVAKRGVKNIINGRAGSRRVGKREF
jgi:hypothetical protein